MNRSAELAAAARRVRALNERMPAAHRLNVEPAWNSLLARIEGQSDRRAVETILEWREKVAAQIVARQLHLPIGIDR
jgi:hypothetical protein